MSRCRHCRGRDICPDCMGTGESTIPGEECLTCEGTGDCYKCWGDYVEEEGEL